MNLNRNTVLLAIAAIGIIITGVLIYANQNPNQFPFLNSVFGASNDAVAKKSLDYLNTTVLAGQAQASLVNVSEESGLVKIKIKIGTSEYDSYATKDGKLLFPQAFNMGDSANQQSSQNNQPAPKNIEEAKASLKKSDSPVVEAFVVSRCPYGLQMQRIMADVIKNIPELAKNMKVRYMGSVSGNTITAMHGEAEAKENLRQICIREEQPAKYWNYVSCQMKASGTEISCEKSTDVDSAKLSSCVSDPNKGVAYAKKDFDLSAKYNVQGSPTVILGDSQVSEFDFGGRSSEALKIIVCAAFNSEPGFCSKILNTAEAATSFSEVYANANSGSSGNSGADGTNCAPAQ